MSKTPTMDKLDLYGDEAVCDDIRNLMMMTEIAKAQGVTLAGLQRWISMDVSRSARVHAARVDAAASYEEEACRLLTEAKDGFQLQKARELAHHYRWRAAKINPVYRDKVDMTHANPEGGPVEMKQTVTHQTAEEAYKKMMEGST